MALPKLNTTPNYELTIPSTGETLKFRPFLVKEQKVLLIAYESQDQQQILSAILDCIQACVEGVNLNRISTFDSDYIFSQIRSKSVGEITDVKVTCKSCGHQSDKKINLNDLKVMGKIKKNIEVELNQDIRVKMKYPTYLDFIKDPKIFSEDTSDTEKIFLTLGYSMDSVMTQEENISLKDETPEEIENFINSLSAEQLEKISSFVQDMPKLRYEQKYKCEQCNHENKIELEGLQDFFS
tara:strand:- start:5483 stop:6199 length:717 start_codon:yes stop_codon:yes gene_type:complete